MTDPIYPKCGNVQITSRIQNKCMVSNGEITVSFKEIKYLKIMSHVFTRTRTDHLNYSCKNACKPISLSPVKITWQIIIFRLSRWRPFVGVLAH